MIKTYFFELKLQDHFSIEGVPCSFEKVSETEALNLSTDELQTMIPHQLVSIIK